MELSREIGGNFSSIRNDEALNSLERIAQANVHFFSSGRSAIRCVLQLAGVNGGKVALPYFTCHSVIEPFVQRGCQVVFYPVGHDLQVSLEVVKNFCYQERPDLFFYHDYFGINQDSIWQNLFVDLRDEMIFVNDQTHSFFSSKSAHGAHFFLMSLRKWGGLSEGGMLRILDQDESKIPYSSRAKDDCRFELYEKASELKDTYLLTGDDSLKVNFRELFYQSEALFDAENDVFPIHPNALVSWRSLMETDFLERRRRNLQFLVDHWREEWRPWSTLVLEGLDVIAPLYCPILLRASRENFQKFLADSKIYAPVIWPKSKLIDVAQDDTLYSHLICLPIDQRYHAGDMSRVLETIEQFHLTQIAK
jgi:hypothetical protein